MPAPPPDTARRSLAPWLLFAVWPAWVVGATLLLVGAHHRILAAGSTAFAVGVTAVAFGVARRLSEMIELRHQAASLTEQLRRSEARARAVVDGTPEAIWTTDGQGRIRLANAAVGRLVGIGDPATMIGQPLSRFLPRAGAALGLGHATIEEETVRPDGTTRSVIVSLSPAGEDGEVAVIARDITERKSLEVRLAHEAAHDSLTGLLSRAGFFPRAQAAIDAARRDGGEVAVVFVDLDRFKAVNDSLGHAAGDQLLAEVSRRLLGQVRPGDLVGRLGGDEFVALLPHPAGHDALVQLGKRIIDALERPFALAADEARISASIGIATTATSRAGGDAPPATADTLIASADIALYRAKQSGRRRIVVFDEALQRFVADRHRHEQAFRLAFEHRELEAWAQPIVRIATGSVTGVELLTRWRRPGVGIVTPDVFLPVAEEAGLTVELGRWLLDRAADALEDWAAEATLADLYVSVNISSRHLLTGYLAADVRASLVRRGIDPRRLVVELAESELDRDLAQARAALQELRALGTGVAIDDFGTGASSLISLRELPASIIKIDQSFTQGATEDARHRAIIRGVVDLAEAFDMDVVVEGIDSAEQASSVLRLGGRYGQGYRFGRPVPLAELQRWMAANGPVARPSPEASLGTGVPVSY